MLLSCLIHLNRCGESILKKCPSCGAEVPEEASFCPLCGASLAEIIPPPTPPIPFFTKLIRAARLDSSLYEAVEHDPAALKHAALAIILVNIFSGIGYGIYSFLRGSPVFPGGIRLAAVPIPVALSILIVLSVVVALIKWLILTGIIYLIGVKVFRGTAGFKEVARTIAFAYAPVIFQVLLPMGILLSGLDLLLLLGTNLWMIVALLIAVRQSLDLTTGKAFLVVLFGGIFYALASAVLF